MDDENAFISPSQRRRIEATVLQILKVSDFDTATEFSVRASAAQTLGFELSGSAQRRLVQHLVDSFLLSNADSILGAPNKNDDGTHKMELNGENHPIPNQHQQVKNSALAAQPNGLGNVICKLSNRRWVTIHDSYGTTVVALRDFITKDGKMLPSKAANAGINLTRAQWSSYRKSFPSIEAAIAKLESQLGRKQQAVRSPKNSSSGSITMPSESDLKLANPMVDSAVGQSQAGTEISNLAKKVHSPVKRKHPQNEAVVNFKTANSDFSRTDHQCIKRRHTEADTSSSANAGNSQEHIRAGQKPEEASGSITALESEENACSDRKSHSGRLIPIQPGRFDGTNFHSWRHQIGFFLNQLNIAYVLDIPCPIKSTTPGANFEVRVTIQRWIDDDYLCRHNILSSLSDSLFQLHSQKAQSAKELWEELNSTYKDDYGTKRSEINKYVHFQMVDGLSILNQVHELDKISNSIMASGTRIDEDFHVGVIISKLPPSWKEVRVRLTHERFVSYNALIQCLEAEEKTRHWKQDDGSEAGVGKRKWERMRVCYGCGQEGHIIKYCSNVMDSQGAERNKEEEEDHDA